MSSEWLKNFKLAIINEDLEQIQKSIENFNIQNFKADEAIEAQALIQSALELFKNASSRIQSEIIKLKNVKHYIQQS
ncbi:hypothetical protein CR66_01335 [Campylobacter mucosalis]|uniref:hypothetical protein n=1 Tax=Campylobacter mucosalis TaxID=202 RepID=UPI0004DA7298|nr:hypothetical protein [Campylobacter mucosalis]KEA46517.1 hypothetical protein CR66_01335 [Campylobacter mucosalis]QKF62985.1 hypothetical protein CMCT_0846 [Campylobacter mucosalis]